MFYVQGTARAATVHRSEIRTKQIVAYFYSEKTDTEGITVFMDTETARLLGQSLLLHVAEIDLEKKSLPQADGDNGTV